MAGIKGQFASQSRMRASDIDSKFHSYGISAAPSDTGISPANKRTVNRIERIFFMVVQNWTSYLECKVEYQHFYNHLCK